MTDSLFDTDNTEAPTIDPEKNYLEELVGEGKKFKTIEDLARGKVESDLFIQRLQAETQEMRSELTNRLNLEAFLDEMKQLQKQAPAVAPSPQDTPRNVDTEPKEIKAGMTPEEVEQLLSERLKNERTKELQASNLATVKNRLVELYGNTYQNKLKEVAESLGESPEYLNEVAKRNPTAFFRLLGETPAPDKKNYTPPRSQLNTETRGNVPSGERDNAFYEHLRATDPKRYYSREVQVQRHKDALRLGAKFFN